MTRVPARGVSVRTGYGVKGALERFGIEKRRHSVARPELGGKIAFLRKTTGPHGWKRTAFQTEKSPVFVDSLLVGGYCENSCHPFQESEFPCRGMVH